MLYGIEKIKTFLPHRAPFLFAQAVDVLEPGKLGRAQIQVCDVDSYWHQETHLSPTCSADVLLLETAAQVFGVVLASDVEVTIAAGGKPPAEGKHLLLGFDNCEIPGDLYAHRQLQLEVALDGVFGSMFKGSFTASVGDQLIARGELTVMQGAA
jgi:3-hydroxymyristoyl/3-hydroxydecanoyl-(acyl carrier protein) dehydratase